MTEERFSRPHEKRITVGQHQASGHEQMLTVIARKYFILAVVAIAAIHLVAVFLRMRTRVYDLDFSDYYVWALALRLHINPYTANLYPLTTNLSLTTHGIFHADYPPLFLLCFEPITLLRPFAAYWTWAALNVLMLFAALFLLIGSDSMMPVGTRFLLCALAVLYEPLLQHFYWSQAQILLLLILVVGLRCFERKSDRLTGLSIAFASLLKIFPAVLMGFLLVTRRWRALFYSLLGLVLGAMLCLLAAGPDVCWSFVKHSYSVQTGYWTAGLSVSSLISRAFVAAFSDRMTPTVDEIRKAVVIACDAALAGLVVFATEMSRRRGREDLSYGLWIVLAIWLFPITWVHHMVLLLIPFAQIASAAQMGLAPHRAVLGAVASFSVSELAAPFFWYYWLFWVTWPMYASGSIEIVAKVLMSIATWELARR